MRPALKRILRKLSKEWRRRPRFSITIIARSLLAGFLKAAAWLLTLLFLLHSRSVELLD